MPKTRQKVRTRMIKLEKVSWVENVVHPSHALGNSPARTFARFCFCKNLLRTWVNGFIQHKRFFLRFQSPLSLTARLRGYSSNYSILIYKSFLKKLPPPTQSPTTKTSIGLSKGDGGLDGVVPSGCQGQLFYFEKFI
jgi:hypothetical protein